MKYIKCIVFLLLLSPSFLFAESPSFFPETNAGITGYAKAENITSENNLTKLTKFVSLLEENENGKVLENKETHVIGEFSFQFMVEDNRNPGNKISVTEVSPYIYLDKDGWVASYFAKDDPGSKIINWKNYTPGEVPENILKKTVSFFCEELELGCSPLKYYHFKFPQANRMTIIIDTLYTPYGLRRNNFSVTIPGKVHEASYSVYYTNMLVPQTICVAEIIVDNVVIDENKIGNLNCRGDGFIYNRYPQNTFLKNKPHSVVFDAVGGALGSTEIRIGKATVLFYEN
jgi:hypothetical protein